MGLVYTQVWRHDGQVGDSSAFRAGELTDAIDRVVVIKEEQEMSIWFERIGLSNKLKRITGI